VRLVTAVAALLRRLRAERGVAALLFLLVAVTSFAVAAGPRLFNRVADDGLRYAARRATAIQRNVQFTSVDHLPAGEDDPFERVVARGDALGDRLPGSVTGLVDETRFVVDSARFQIQDPPNYQTFVTFRYQDGLDEQLELVDGRWPAAVPPVPPDEVDPDAPPRFELALSDATLAAIGVEVGDTLAANVDPSDPVLRDTFPRPTTAIEIEVVGSFAIDDPAARFWFDDRGLGQIAIGGSDDDPIAFATGLFAPDAYADLLALGLPSRYRWREFVDADRLDAGQLGALVPDLRRLESSSSTTGVLRPGTTIVRSGLQDVIGRYLVQRATSEAALSVAALGPLTVAAGAVGLVGYLVIRRRRAAIALARGRGASGGQLLAAQLWEGLLLTIPAGLVGLAASIALVPARASNLSPIGAILVALGATGLLLVSTWPAARRARRELERENAAAFRLSPRRLVFESLIVGLSLAAAWLLRERGLSGAGSSDGAGFDPFLAATPLLVGLACGLLTIRLYPLPVRALGWLMARRRDLVPVLGLRNLGRRPATGYLPLLILMLTVAIGTFSSVVQASIERSQVEVAWQEVGADYRIATSSGDALDATLDPRTIDGVEAVAAGLVDPGGVLSTGPGRRTGMLIVAIEASAYATVLAGSAVTPDLPVAFANPPTGPGAGAADRPIPAIVSTRWPNGNDPLAMGDTFELTINGQTLSYRLEGSVASFPGIAPRESFVVVPFESVAAAWHGSLLRPTDYFVRAPQSIADDLRLAQGSDPGAPVVDSRYERFAAMHDAPLVAAVVGGFAVALLVAAAYAALAVIALVILHAQHRSRELAFLRTLGLTDRQVASLTLVEQGLPVALALAIGVALGIGLAWMLAPGIDLAAFSSPDTTVLLRVDWASVAGVAAAVVGVVAAAIGASSWLARRLDLGQALRIGEE